ncbi:AAWKG family protein [Streptomyces sp. NPDC088354]|uniref:AAWKG family protein n=1 Tax=Streptomyces sp. NPDC088354 TaxID=3365856 RepID=UPI00380F32E2
MADDPNDYWRKAVALYTGYQIPNRGEVFDDLKDPDGIPLFRIGFGLASTPGGSGQLTPENFTAMSAWQANGLGDYSIAYVYESDGGWQLKQANCVFIGSPGSDSGRIRLLTGGEIWEAGKFKGSFSGSEWDLTKLSQYLGGPKVALEYLKANHTTRGLSWHGYTVADPDVVDFGSFERTAQAFDRTMKFFEDHGEILAQWETSLGGEDAVWHGEAAGLFAQLIHQLKKNYEDYADQFTPSAAAAAPAMPGGFVPKSKFSQALATAQNALMAEVQNLSQAWDEFAADGRHDPHLWLYLVLNDLTVWVLQNNIMPSKVYKPSPTADPQYIAGPGFSQVHPVYGNINEKAAWKKVGEEAVTRWNNHVQVTLVDKAAQSMANLKRAWSDLEKAFTEVRTRDNTTLTASYADSERKNAQKEAEKEKGNLNNLLNNLGNGLGDLGKGVGDSIGDLGGNISALGKNLGGGLGNLSDGLGESLGNLSQGLGDGLGNLTGGAGGGGLGNLTDGLGEGLGNLTGGAGGGGLGGHTSGLGAGLNFGALPGKTDDGNSATKGSTLTNPDGSTTTLNSDGTLTTRYPDGTKQLLDPETGVITTTAPDGTVTTGDLTAPAGHVNPDGSTTTLNPDGTLTTVFPDGTKTTIDPETGNLTTTDPDGTVTTGTIGSSLGGSPGDFDIPDFAAPPTTSNTPDIDWHNLFPGGSAGSPATHGGSSALTSDLSDGLGTGGQFADYSADYDADSSDLLSGGALGAPSSSDLGPGTASAAPPGGVPLFPGLASGIGAGSSGGMPMMGGMGGMGGGGGAGDSGNKGERVRNVLSDAGSAPTRGRSGNRRNAEDDEDIAVARRRAKTTGSGALLRPLGDNAKAQTTMSGDRSRIISWVQEEDEDVWGTDEGGAPAVIGR